MSYSCLPSWPLVLFGVLEPFALVWAYITAMTDGFTFFASQAPNHEIGSADFTPQAQALTLQMGNVLLLLGAMAIICCWTKHPEIAKWYLIAVAFADIGHIYAVYAAVGPAYFWNFAEWNDMTWGNVGVSAFLHVNRWATVAGLFGSMSGEQARVKKVQ
ncbi:uncharacterized protein RHO25_010066 [Cercospora beticola]|uniref:DUF7704 domain-containing protein n=1 Tax=Cercospora beticola TaxID=122368 RepID=A0ABZ0P0S5_CERBT|nr:hypothetical protein RHO25_010066 [Cercospora beticola]CAK1365217.1 unnamed protein product [Cercospora beticola]